MRLERVLEASVFMFALLWDEKESSIHWKEGVRILPVAGRICD